MAGESSFGTILVSFMMDVVLLAGVPLAVATLFGLIVSFFQAITQIQDQTLGQTIKIVAITVTLMAFGTVLTAPLLVSTRSVFQNFDQIVR